MLYALIRSVFLGLAVVTAGVAGAQAEDPATAERAPLVVALDGSGQYRSIQEAVDAAKKGDTILIRPGAYPEDVTIHSKENVRLIGAGMDQVTILGRERVGVFHIGKWPYGPRTLRFPASPSMNMAGMRWACLTVAAFTSIMRV